MGKLNPTSFWTQRKVYPTCLSLKPLDLITKHLKSSHLAWPVCWMKCVMHKHCVTGSSF